MPRFVILEHDHPFIHWDFMLETGEVLKTWRLLNEPTVDLKNPQKFSSPAEPLSDHRLEYLHYEGEISRARGNVTQWDTGKYAPVLQSETHQELRLEGSKLIGFACISKTEPQTDADQTWAFLFIPDSLE